MQAPCPDWMADAILAHLAGLADPANVEGMNRFGIRTEGAFGISTPVLRGLAKKLGRNHERSLALWQTGQREARLVALFTAEPRKLTATQARLWAEDFDSWEIVDTATSVFCDAHLAAELIDGFAADEREFIRRAAFALMAWGAVHMKKEPDAKMLSWLPLIERHATDPRNFVRKAVNWALRQIGKRNLACHGPALALAERLAASSDKTARWIGKDAVRELAGDALIARLRAKQERSRA